MLAYAKKAVAAHHASNCVTDFMFEESLRIPAVVDWPHSQDSESLSGDLSRDRSLMGVPVSIKGTSDSPVS